MKEGDFLFNRTSATGTPGTVGARSPGAPMGLIDPITGTLGTLEYDHQDGISITGGFVYRGSLIPELFGKYVFGDLALTAAPVRANGRLFYADLTTGQIFEFQLPQFMDGILPDGLTVHGFGEDANGELYALATNTPANGSGGVIYQISTVPEPSAAAQIALTVLGLLAFRRRRAAARAAVILLCCGGAAQAVTLTLRPNHDNSLFDENDNSNAKGPLFAGVTVNTGAVRRALLEFDLANSGIPAGAVINSVSLSLTVTKAGPAPAGLFELHPLLAAWGEGTSNAITSPGQGTAPTPGDATWHFRLYQTQSWNLPGGDFGSTSGTTTIGTALGAYTFASQPGMVSDVQGWLASPSSNFGWMIKAADESALNGNARELGSRESTLSQQPLLVITYTPAPEPGSLGLFASGAALLALRRPR
jgi:hypothetical protein